MRSVLRIFLLTLLAFSCIDANAQWLKKIESSDNLYKDAKREIDLKHYQKAINMCSKAVDISPHNLDIHFLLGKAYALAGKVDSARTELNYVIDKSPNYRDAYIYLVNMEAVACNYLQALEYADMGLKHFPNDRELLLKKLDIYNKEGDWIESNKLAEYLFERYSTDAYIRNIYLDYKLTLARQYAHRGYIEISKRAYEAVLEQEPLNKEALQAVFALDVRAGNYESSLAFTNRALQSTPNSYEFLMKKISILDAMSRYIEAIEVVEKLLKLFPSNSEVQKLNIYLRMEAGRYYMNTDPYIQFQAVLEKDPGNRDALNYVINIAYSRGLLNDALGWCNTALKKYPNDRDLLTKKMSILEGLKSYGRASSIAESVYKGNPTPDNKEHFIELRTLSGKQYLNDQEYDSAIVALKSVLFYDHGNTAAINYLVGAYVQQKRYDDALHTIDEALTYYPGNENLLYKKAGVLEEYQHYADAALISKDLLQRYPETKQYLVSFVEQSLEAGRQSMLYDDYYSTVNILREVLEKQPDNVDALNYIINIESANKQFDSALYYCDLALHYYPDSKDFQFKKSSVYSDAKQFQQAYAISGNLYSNYPYNIRFRTAYTDQLLGSGRQYLANGAKDSALMEFYKALAVAPNDSNVLIYTINLTADNKEYDTAFALIDRGRALYPSSTVFLLKRAQILESQKRWESAYLSADTLSKMTPLDLKMLDYTRSLYSKRLKNEIGLFYLHSRIFDSTNTTNNSIATIQYSHKYTRGTYTFRINYAGRSIGTGFQGEAEAYYNHTPRWYSFGVAAYSPNQAVFPKIRLGYSIFHSFNKGWDGELGLRYLKADSGTIYSGVASVAKSFNDFYFNLRGYYIYLDRNTVPFDIANAAPGKKDQYYSVILTSRYFLNDFHTDYVSTIMGYGTAPDDFSQSYNIQQLLAYNTVSVGAGYTKQIQYRTTLGIFGSWYNEKLTTNFYRNQYDIYLSFLRKF